MSDYELTHPIYLDISMMMSFLAFLEGGVDMGGEQTTTTGSMKEKRGEVGAKIKFPSLAGIFNAEASAAASMGKTVEQTLEYTAVRHHTAASLFNGLYSYLREDGRVLSLENREQLISLDAGQLVEMRGVFRGNPVEQIVEIAIMLLGYLEHFPERQQVGQGAELMIPVIRKMHEDLNSSPVRDARFETSAGLQAVLTLDSQYYAAATRESLRFGEFTVLGKVTQMMIGEGSINLARRTVLGAVGADIAQRMVAQSTTGGLRIEFPDPVVTAPLVQILPMAIFI